MTTTALGRAKVPIFFVLCILGTALTAKPQDRLSRLEWFIEGGGSFLNLGKQSNEVTILETAGAAGTLVSPDQFTSGGLVFTGLRYHLTAKDALEASYDCSYWNYFQIQPTTPYAGPLGSRVERNEWSFNYVRYLPARGVVQPFLTAGAGAIQTATLTTQWHAYNPSVNFGFGTDFRLNERLAFRLEVRDRIGFLPAPLRGASHDLSPTAGLVFSSRTASATPSRFPQVAVFLEGGASVITRGGPGSAGQYGAISSNGLIDVDLVARNSYSKSGRLMAGFRVLLTNNNALEASFSESPNRYTARRIIPALSIELPSAQVTQEVDDYAVNYVRCFRRSKDLQPFITAGAGLAHFAGIVEDVDRFGWNIGIGADFRLWKRLAARFEIRDYMSTQPGLGTIQATGLAHNVAPTAGLAYRFN